MRVRFGYVAISLDLKQSSTNRTITVTNLQKLPQEVHILKLKQLSQENLHNQLRILKHNAASDIKVFRFTSKLVPLATHEVASGWQWEKDLAEPFQAIGDFVKKHRMRVSFHPDHFVKINSPNPDVLQSSIAILDYHQRQCEAMGLDETMKFNIHMGGMYQDRDNAFERFILQWQMVPLSIQKRITLENDDKTFTARETLSCCQKLGIPFVLDLHHHRCNHEEDSNLEEMVEDIFHTWHQTGLPPKIHISSPKDEHNPKEIRAHADIVAVSDLLPFLFMARSYTDQLDVMIEAKHKDLALHQLMHDLTSIDDVRVLDQATVEI